VKIALAILSGKLTSDQRDMRMMYGLSPWRRARDRPMKQLTALRTCNESSNTSLTALRWIDSLLSSAVRGDRVWLSSFPM
jgi:hypothetical protein